MNFNDAIALVEQNDGNAAFSKEDLLALVNDVSASAPAGKTIFLYSGEIGEGVFAFRVARSMRGAAAGLPSRAERKMTA